jgi:hypothetical protein
MKANKSGLSFRNREILVEGQLCRAGYLVGDDFRVLDDPEGVAKPS